MEEQGLIDYCGIFPCIDDFKKSVDKNSSIENFTNQLEILSEVCNLEEIINLNLQKLLFSEKKHITQGNIDNLILLTEDDYDLSILCNLAKPDSFEGQVIYSYANDVIFCPLLDNHIDYKVFHQNKTNDHTLLNKSFILDEYETNKLTFGKSIYLQKFRHVLYLDKYKPFVSFVVKFKKPTLNYSWEYSSETLVPIRIALINTNIGRLETSLKIISQIGNSDSLDVLKRFVDNDIHTTRWETVSALINVDYDYGVSILKQMSKNDPHEEVQTAATKSLILLNE